LEKFGERGERKYNGILSDDVIIDGKTLKKKIFVVYESKIESWEIIFKTTDNWESRGVERRKCST
jgi:hypothetical protein